MTDPTVSTVPWWARSRSLARTWAALLSTPGGRFDLVAAMTLALLLFYAEPIWYLKAGAYTFAVLAVLHRPALRSAGLWLLTALVLAVGHLGVWSHIDNHEYLVTYWSLAIGLSLLAPAPLRALRTNARLLIGLAFLFASVGKVASPDYLSGAFFEGLLLTDDRFFRVSSLFGGVPRLDLLLGALAHRDLLVFGDPTVPVPLPSTPRLFALAQVLTWWTLVIEGVVALLFLWPEDRGPSRWRDVALLLFLVTTYPLARVLGFAWVLAAMGAAQSTERGGGYLPVLYVTACLVVTLTS